MFILTQKGTNFQNQKSTINKCQLKSNEVPENVSRERKIQDWKTPIYAQKITAFV